MTVDLLNNIVTKHCSSTFAKYLITLLHISVNHYTVTGETVFTYGETEAYTFYAIRSLLLEDKIVILYAHVHLVCSDTVWLAILRDLLQHTENSLCRHTFSIRIYCQTCWF
jgi:hypothetical protein